MSILVSNTDEKQLLKMVKNAMECAYAPYSHYPVGVVLIDENGQISSGCNVENASYPEGNCAETSAIGAMIMTGGKQINAIYIMSQDKTGATPCGGCRQRIREFSTENTQIVLCSPHGVEQRLTIENILPYSFGPEFLK